MRHPSIFILLCTLVLAAGCAGARDAAEDVAGEAAETARDVADEVPGVGETTLTATLTGAAEVPGPGDPDGRGSATVVLDPEENEVCYDISVSGIATATAAHIHRGAAGESGGPVVPFDVAGDGLEGCVSNIERSVINAIRAQPAAYYVNVHNADHPGGAVRGQLED